MNTHLYAGNRVVLLSRFEPQTTLDAMIKEKVNFWTGVPTMYWALLRHAEENDIDTSPIAESIKVVTSGGAPMPVEVMREFTEKFNVRILEGYGMSETSPLATFQSIRSDRQNPARSVCRSLVSKFDALTKMIKKFQPERAAKSLFAVRM